MTYHELSDALDSLAYQATVYRDKGGNVEPDDVLVDKLKEILAEIENANG